MDIKTKVELCFSDRMVLAEVDYWQKAGDIITGTEADSGH